MNRTFNRKYFEHFNRIKTTEEVVADQYLSKPFETKDKIIPVDQFDTIDFDYKDDLLLVRAKCNDTIVAEITQVMNKMQQFIFRTSFTTPTIN